MKTREWVQTLRMKQCRRNRTEQAGKRILVCFVT